MDKSTFTPVVPLNNSHERDTFQCGSPPLDLYLRNYAIQNQKKGIVRNYITTRKSSEVVVAYYSLVYSSLDQKQLPQKVVKGLGRYDIPVILLARLAVDQREQSQGLGKSFLKDAILRTIQAAEIAGLKLLLVHAKDDSASAFYQKHGFVTIVDEPFKLFLPIHLAV